MTKSMKSNFLKSVSILFFLSWCWFILQFTFPDIFGDQLRGLDIRIVLLDTVVAACLVVWLWRQAIKINQTGQERANCSLSKEGNSRSTMFHKRTVFYSLALISFFYMLVLFYLVFCTSFLSGIEIAYGIPYLLGVLVVIFYRIGKKS